MSLSFDDGLASQLEVAVPALDARGLRATFYVPAAGAEDKVSLRASWRELLGRWRRVAEAGHEIGNHTVMHPCSLNIDTEREWGSPGANTLDWTLERIEADVLEARRRIAETIPSQGENSFAYPCYESTVGRGERRVSYTPFVARHFVAARASGEIGVAANDPVACDLHHLSSFAVERQSGPFMVGLVERSIARGRWAIFTFHGIGEGHLPVAQVDLDELLNHLVARSGVVWTAPVSEIGTYVRTSQERAAEVA